MSTFGKKLKMKVGCCAGQTESDGVYRNTVLSTQISPLLTQTSRSQSRMRGDYLFYEEKVETTKEERDVKAARRSISPLDPT